MRLYFLYGALLLVACSQSKPQEHYNVITVTEYKNSYDIIGRLSRVEIRETQNMYTRNNNSEAFATTSYRLQEYEYQTDLDYTVKEDFDSSAESKITIRTGKTEERLHVKNGKDTISYYLCRYYDENKPEYTKDILMQSDEVSTERGYETYYYYDKKGSNIRKISTNLETKKSEEFIVCEREELHKDTIVTQILINGVLNSIKKEFTDGKKKIEQTELRLDSNRIYVDTYTEYEENGFKVNVSKNMSNLSYEIDSIYTRNNKKVKSTNIYSYDKMKIVTTAEYDKKGNIIKTISKTKL